MEASSTFQIRKSEGDVARLTSRVVQVPRVCFSFHYHMYGRDMGALRINIRFKNGTEVNKWNMTGNQGNRWHRAQVSIENPDDYQVINEINLNRRICLPFNKINSQCIASRL